MDDLKTCPFCGEKATIRRGMHAFIDVEIGCDNCGFSGPNFGSVGDTETPEADAIAAWNTRAILPAQGQDEPVAWRDAFDECTCGQTCVLHPAPAVSLPEDVAGLVAKYRAVRFDEAADAIEAQAAELARMYSVIADALGRYQVTHIHEGLRAALSPADSKEGE